MPHAPSTFHQRMALEHHSHTAVSCMVS
ncbi:hypothetical protein MAR_031078 [Mya arenaria]|uniref:Uncharacterized protein n=1 Tax=Mya arenaria TaxID=6604 RepID=A0ABY7F533_MYAAR|nr:hypothetical protein MAR_031078 [Mya arenaria]